MKNRKFRYFTAFLVLGLGATLSFAGNLSVPITVKETAGVGAQGYPITVVIPLPEGAYHTTQPFGIRQGSTSIPAQVDVLTRYWGRDDSIRQVAVHFQPSVASNGSKDYEFHDDGGNPAPPERVSVQDEFQPGKVRVDTGPLRFTIDKRNFTILDTVWLDSNGDGDFVDGERLIVPSSDHGGRFEGCTAVSGGSCQPQAQHDRGLGQPTVEIEEAGPMRAVIKIWRATRYVDSNDDQDTEDAGEYHRHGYAVRIFAYAGKPWVKIDYQLQNSPKGPDPTANKFGAWGNPMYFRSLNLEWNLELSGTLTATAGTGGSGVERRTVGGGGVELAHTFHDDFQVRPLGGGSPFVDCRDDCFSQGFLDVSNGSSGVTVVVRNMWQTWPNGIAVDGSGRLSVGLWPDWSSQFVRVCDNDASTLCLLNIDCDDNVKCSSLGFTTADLYWLDDMRHVYKETVLRFHDGSMSKDALVDFAETVQTHPVPVVDFDWYNQTRTTLDITGINPNPSRIGSDTRRVEYAAKHFDSTNPESYLFGWDTWRLANVSRKGSPAQGGGQPHSSEQFLATESPDDYWNATYKAIAELNVRPQWMADYSFDRDWDTIGLTQAPYGDGHWRAQAQSSGVKERGSYPISGSGYTSKAMDDQHAWMYHIEEAYHYDANPWIRDFYEFLGEFRKHTLTDAEAYPDKSQRGRGHMAASAMQAFRITGDESLPGLLCTWIRDHRRADLNLECGQGERTGDLGAPAYYAYLWRPLIFGMQHFDGYDNQAWAELFSYMSSGIEYNYHFAKYGYHVNHNHGGEDCTVNIWGSSGNASTVPDTVSWYYWNTGRTKYKVQNDKYVSSGLDGGGDPYGNWSRPWDGEYHARTYLWETGQNRTDATPPSRINDLAATQNGSSLKLEWTAPQQAERYLVVWADRMISEEMNQDTTQFRNWWAATPVGPSFSPRPGQREQLTINVGAVQSPHAAIFTFDGAGNMSSMSNVAHGSGGATETPDPPTDLRED